MAVQSQETDAGHLCARIHVQGSRFFIRLPSYEEEEEVQNSKEDKKWSSGLQTFKYHEVSITCPVTDSEVGRKQVYITGRI